MRTILLGVYVAALVACSGVHVAPNPPLVKGDRRYIAFDVMEDRDRALNAHDLDALALIYSPA